MGDISWSRIFGDEFVENFSDKFKNRKGNYKWWKILFISLVVLCVIGFYISVFAYIGNPDNKDAARAALILALILSTVYFIWRGYKYTKKKASVFNILDKLDASNDISGMINNSNFPKRNIEDNSKELQSIMRELAMLTP
jgi:hypothetical protein